MKTIHAASLLKFNSDCKEHLASFKKINGYNFNTNIETIKTLFENTHFKNGVIFTEEDLNKFVVEGTFMIGIDFEDEHLDDWKYLFDAFNVYWCGTGNTYIKDSQLTKKWRQIMKAEYANSTYALDLRIQIEEDRKKALAEINADYDKQIESL